MTRYWCPKCQATSPNDKRCGVCETMTFPVPDEAAGWRPVETAPKDAMIIGGYFGKDREGEDYVTLCWWQEEFGAFISSCRRMSLAAGYSFEGGGKTKLHSPEIRKITHWMPLPAAPV